jgi:hypothetical protein
LSINYSLIGILEILKFHQNKMEYVYFYVIIVSLVIAMLFQSFGFLLIAVLAFIALMIVEKFYNVLLAIAFAIVIIYFVLNYLYIYAFNQVSNVKHAVHSLLTKRGLPLSLSKIR